jgi:hypothetical protein
MDACDLYSGVGDHSHEVDVIEKFSVWSEHSQHALVIIKKRSQTRNSNVTNLVI